MEETITADALLQRYAWDSAALQRHELLVDGHWQRFTVVDEFRTTLNGPVLLYTDDPEQGERRLPRDAEVRIRPAQA